MDLLNILTLLKTPYIGRMAIKFILDNFQGNPSSTDALLNVIKDARNINRRIKLPTLSELNNAKDKAHNIIKTTELKKIKIIGIEDKLFPQRLKCIPDTPVLLYVKGNADVLNKAFTVAIIGTREPTDFGKKVGRDLSRMFAKSGFVVVSGLAIGCDTVAHLGCLDANGLSIAVLPGGVEKVYPMRNQSLSEEILKKGGCLISEYELDIEPRASNFVERDRLQSGLSQAVIVIETGVQGGSLHTVNFARQQQRTVACISNHPKQYEEHPKIQGNIMLVKDGATSLGNNKDISDFITHLKSTEKQDSTKQPELKRSSKKKEVQGELFT